MYLLNRLTQNSEVRSSPPRKRGSSLLRGLDSGSAPPAPQVPRTLRTARLRGNDGRSALRALSAYAAMTIFLLLPLSLQALGIRTITGSIAVEDVPIGSTVSLRQISNKVYRVMNTSEFPYKVVLAINLPIEGEGIKSGYEPLPDAAWVRLEKDLLELGPGQEGLVDLIFTLPDDPNLFGKKFQGFIHSRSVPDTKVGMGLSLGVKSILLIAVAKDRMTAEQKEKMKEIKNLLNFDVVPKQIEIFAWPKGKKIDPKKTYKKSIKIINPNDEPIKVDIAAIEARDAFFDLAPESREGQPGWVDPWEMKNVSIEGNTIYEIPITIKIPKKQEGNRFIFSFRVTLLGFEVPVHGFCRVYIHTKD